MTHLTRRETLKVIGAASLAGAFTWTDRELADAWAAVGAARRQPQGYTPKFFTAAEWETVRLLVDMIIPRDERSGSATDAGVPEFIDFVMTERENGARRTAMRGGLAWLDMQCRERFGKDRFVACTDDERRRVLNDIAYPGRAATEFSHGVEFFTSFRNLTASGFWSSKMGVADLQYMGNEFVTEWNGCPEEQLRRLGLEG